MKKKLVITASILFSLLLQTLPAQITSEMRDFQYAYGLYSDDLYNNALEAFNRFEQKYPHSTKIPEALYYQGDCHFFLGKYDAAIAKYNSLISRFPQNMLSYETRLRLAQAYYYNQEYSGGESAIAVFLKRNPDNAEALYWFGEILYGLEKYELSEERLLRSIDLDSSSVDVPYAYNTLIYAAAASGDTVKAVSYADIIIRRWSGHVLFPEVLLLKGKLLAGIKRYEKARVVFKYAFDHLHNRQFQAEAMFNIGKILIEEEEWPEAARAFETIVMDFSDTQWIDESRYNLGWVYLKMKRYDSAATALENASALAADSLVKVLSLLKLGQVYVAQEKIGEAAIVWQKIISDYHEPEAVAQAQYELGVLTFREKKYSEALQHFQSADKSQMTNMQISAKKMQAECFLALGDEQSASDLLSSLSPENEEIMAQGLYQRGWIAYKNKKWDYSEKIFRQVMDMKASDKVMGLTGFWLGEIYFNVHKKYKSAAAYYLPSSNFEHEKKNEALYGYSWSLLKIAKYSKAEKSFSKLITVKELDRELKLDVQLRLADLSFAMKKYSLAATRYEGIYKDLAQLSIENQQYLMFQLALTYRRQNRYEDARRVYDSAANKFPAKRDQSLLMKAEVLFVAEKYTEFNAEARAILPTLQDPCTRAKTMYEIGDAQYNTQQYKSALDMYKQAITEPDCDKYIGPAWSGILYASIAAGDITLAENILGEIKSRLSVENLYQLRTAQAKYLLNNNRYDGADKAINEAIAIAPSGVTKAEAYRLQADYYKKTNRNDKALESREKAFANFSNDNDKAEMALAVINELRVNGETEEMGNWITKTKRLKNVNSKYTRELILYDAYYKVTVKDWAGAAKSLEKFDYLSKSSKRNSYLSSLRKIVDSNLFIHEKKFSQAENNLNSILSKRTDNLAAEAQLHLGYLNRARGKRDAAAEDFLRVRYLYPGVKPIVARAMYEAAAIYAQDGKADKADKIVEKMENEFGDSKWTAMARKLSSR